MALTLDPDLPVFTAGTISNKSFKVAPNGSAVSSDGMSGSCTLEASSHRYRCEYQTAIYRGSFEFTVIKESFPDQTFVYRVLERASRRQTVASDGTYYEASDFTHTFNEKGGPVSLLGSYQTSESAAPQSLAKTYVLDSDGFTQVEEIDGRYRTRQIFAE